MSSPTFIAPSALPPRDARASPPRRAPTCSARPPPRRRSVRVHRRYTHRRAGWEWRGGAEKPNLKWMGMFCVDETVLKAIEMLWSRGGVEPSIFERVKALGRRVLRSFTYAIERTLYPDTEKELVVEYGLTDPSPADKTYVDPLHDWEMSSVTYYSDSFGRPVYLQLDGATGFVAATDYRDQFEEGVEGEDDPDSDLDHPPHRPRASFNILRIDHPGHPSIDPSVRDSRPRDDT